MTSTGAPAATLPTLTALAHASRRPEPFEPSEAPFWDDPYIGTQLLAAHLDDSHAGASRPGAEIEATVAHLVAAGLAGPGRRVLDLGCGPGLYAQRLAAAGCEVTGIDLSPGSVEHARAAAQEQGVQVDYRVQDFRTLDEPHRYDLVLQVYGELSTFADPVRDDLLRRVRSALAPGGAFVCDVSTPAAHTRGVGARHWEVTTGGLWRAGAHLVLTERLGYPGDVTCDQYVVVDDAGAVTYRMWFHDYVPTTLRPVLGAAGLAVTQEWGSLVGGPYHDGDEWLAVVARAA